MDASARPAPSCAARGGRGGAEAPSEACDPARPAAEQPAPAPDPAARRLARRASPLPLVAAVEGERRTFAELPFGDRDAAVLSELSRFSFAGLTGSLPPGALPGDAPGSPSHLEGRTGEGRWRALADIMADENLEALHDERCSWSPRHDPALVRAVGSSPRYGAVRAGLHASRRSKAGEPARQFSATTFLLPDGTCAVVFRGTDLTLAGWKEDLDMLSQPSVPAQRDALAYLSAAAALVAGPLRLMGHSKGGTLAEYAALHAEAGTLARIASVHNLDGPGLSGVPRDDPAYAAVLERSRKVVPRPSFYGLLFCDVSRCRVVGASGIALQAHPPGRWRFDATGEPAAAELSPCTSHVAARLQDWLAAATPQRRRRFVDGAFALAEATGADTLPQAARALALHPAATARAWRALGPERRRLLRRGAASLGARIAGSMARGLLKSLAAALRRAVGRMRGL